MYCEEFLCFDISGIYLLPWPVLILPGILMTGRAYVLMAYIIYLSSQHLPYLVVVDLIIFIRVFVGLWDNQVLSWISAIKVADGHSTPESISV